MATSEPSAATSSSSSSSSTTKAEFAVDDEVLAFHGPLLYDAKVIKIDLKKDPPAYFMHYKGWNKKWDEWVATDRVKKRNAENLKLQEDLRKKVDEKVNAMEKKKEKEREKEKDDKRPKNKGKGSKRKAEENVDSDNDDVVYQEIKLEIPGTLKQKLVTDWENITSKKKLVPLPREITVAKLLKEFLASRTKKSLEKVHQEIAEGLRVYFDRALGTVLLYRFERPQYEDLLAEKGKDMLPSEYYGAEHLIRMFVKLPEFLANTQMPETQTTLLQRHLTDFIKWLHKKSDIFTEDYKDTDEAYRARVDALDVPASKA